MSETDTKPHNVVELPRKDESEGTSAVAAFVRDHPLLVVAGGIALGAIAASFLPRGTGRKLVRRAANLAEIAGTASALLGSQMLDKAQSAGAGMREQGGAMADRLERLGGDASSRLGQLSEAAGARFEKLIDPVESAASMVAKKAAELRARVRH